MGILDQLVEGVGALGGGEDGEGQDKASMLQAVLGAVEEKEGGLGGVVSQLKDSDLGSQVSSWVGSGDNDAVEGGQLEQALGSDFVSGIASKLGVSPAVASGALASLLPVVVDKLTPNGDEADMQDGSLASKGMSLLGGLLNK